jgi:WD40 repeat protein
MYDPGAAKFTEVTINATRSLVAAADSNGDAYVWNPASGSQIDEVTNANGTSASAISFSPDGRTLAIAGPSGVMLWNAAQRKVTATLPVPGSGATAVAFSPTGDLLAVANSAGAVYLLAYPSGKPYGPVARLGADGDGLDFSLNGAMLMAYDGDSPTIYRYAIKY